MDHENSMNFQPPPSKFQALFLEVASETYKGAAIDDLPSRARWFSSMETCHKSMVIIDHFWPFPRW